MIPTITQGDSTKDLEEVVGEVALRETSVRFIKPYSILAQGTTGLAALLSSGLSLGFFANYLDKALKKEYVGLGVMFVPALLPYVIGEWEEKEEDRKLYRILTISTMIGLIGFYSIFK